MTIIIKEKEQAEINCPDCNSQQYYVVILESCRGKKYSEYSCESCGGTDIRDSGEY